MTTNIMNMKIKIMMILVKITFTVMIMIKMMVVGMMTMMMMKTMIVMIIIMDTYCDGYCYNMEKYLNSQNTFHFQGYKMDDLLTSYISLVLSNLNKQRKPPTLRGVKK